MKRFLKSKWRSIPVGVVSMVLIFALVAGSAFAAYNFWSADVDMEVLEALEIQVDGTDNTWIDGDGYRVVPDGYTFTIPDAHPGESASIHVKVVNVGWADLTASMSYTVASYPAGGATKVTVTSDWTGGRPVAAQGSTEAWVECNVANDAPPGAYTVQIGFNRY